MEVEKNIINNNSLSEDRENILKQEKKFIQEEFKNKLEEHKKLKEELKNVKISFHNGLNEYTREKNLTIQKEQEIEAILSKISKMKKSMLLSINQTVNKKFYNHLLEISNNKHKEKILLKYFNFPFNVYNFTKMYITSYNNNNNSNFNIRSDLSSNTNSDFFKHFNDINKVIDNTQKIHDLLKIIRSENEIKNVLSYSYEIFHNLQEENNDIYVNIKNSFYEVYNEINNKEKQYPFDFLFDYMKNIFDIIDYERQVEDLKHILNKLTQEKNAKFVEIKNIESVIRTYNINIKIISNYIKALKNFAYRIKEQNKNTSNNSDNNNNKNNNALRELIDDIEKFKKITIDYAKINSNLDAMTSLSFGTNYTLSEKSSNKSSIIDAGFNNDFDSEYKSDNFNSNTNDIISKGANNNNNKIDIKNIENNNNNMMIIKKDNSGIKNVNDKLKKINKKQKNSSRKKTLNLNLNNYNNDSIGKRKYEITKKNISLTKHNIENLTTTDTNIYNKRQIKKQINKSHLNINNKIQNKSNISYLKDSQKKKTLNNSIISKSKKHFVTKINGQKLMNNNFRKRFNTNYINNVSKSKNISPDLKPTISIKKNCQTFKSNKINLRYGKKFKNRNIISQNEKEINENKNEININYSTKQDEEIFCMSDKNTEKDIEDKQLTLSHNHRYDFQGKNRYNISKKIERLKQKEQDESIEFTIPNKDYTNNDDYYDINNIKDSICDEMISQNFVTANSLVRSTTNDYINKLGFKNNVLWSENLYKNKALKFKSNFKKLNIEKPIDTSSCCAACT